MPKTTDSIATPSTTTPAKTKKVLVRRTKKGVPNTRIRYDAAADKWGVLGSDDRAVSHFEQGYLTGVTFTVLEKPVGFGCGRSVDRIGIAEGTFFEGVLPKDSDGFNNIKFYRGFADQNECPLFSADTVVLLPGRKAIYK